MTTLEIEQRQYYERTAEAYEDSHVKAYDEHNLALVYAIALMRSLGIRSVLDVGAGTGRATRALLSAGFEVTGIEPVKALVETATRLGVPSGTILRGDGRMLPFSDSAFDAVCAFGVLHHVRIPNRVVSELTRVARTGIFISDTNRFGRAGMLSRLAKLILWKLHLWRMAYLIWTKGRGCDVSECDGIAYSYSVYDSLVKIERWANWTILIPTKVEGKHVASWFHPLLTSSHVLLCGLRERDKC